MSAASVPTGARSRLVPWSPGDEDLFGAMVVGRAEIPGVTANAVMLVFPDGRRAALWWNKNAGHFETVLEGEVPSEMDGSA